MLRSFQKKVPAPVRVQTILFVQRTKTYNNDKTVLDKKYEDQAVHTKGAFVMQG